MGPLSKAGIRPWYHATGSWLDQFVYEMTTHKGRRVGPSKAARTAGNRIPGPLGSGGGSYMEGAPCIDVGGDVAPRVGTSANQCLRRPFGETSLRYAPHPGAPHTGNMDPGQLGNVLPKGEDYRPHEMQAMMSCCGQSTSTQILVFSAPWCRPCDISAARHSRVLIRPIDVRLHGKPDPVPTGPQGGMARPSG